MGANQHKIGGLARSWCSILALCQASCHARSRKLFIFFVPHIVALWYMVQAYQGRYCEILVISRIAREQHWV